MATPRTPGPGQVPAGAPISNLIFQQLCELGLAAPERLEMVSPGTRDTEVPVYRDALSGVIVLGRNIYADPSGRGDVTVPCRPRDLNEVETSGGSVSTPVLDDGRRRFQQFQEHLRGKRVCDFGAGEGDFIENCLQAGCAASGVEQGATTINKLRARFAERALIAPDLDGLEGAFEVITLFHVLEHIEDHLGALRRIGAALVEDGLLIVEVPHARDFLLQEMELPAFRDFTFWSEHLILHTRESLRAFLEAAGYSDVTVRGYQRYTFGNHLGWLRHGRPGGHEIFAHFSTPELEKSYAAMLEAQDRTDTLIALARM